MDVSRLWCGRMGNKRLSKDERESGRPELS